ncbi:WbqC family protein [Chryseobacterium phocaeense]|uniref:WbqC family protein n=1 Tax=Chryseobacterium phocaeense TaxID=1816690 RepID=UPI0009BA6E38|nr:WbqC family protein [Chryseobacterium phocaeense]
MKIAIMQPYFMPYIGYFQLIHSVDKFIIYDDVNYIKQGWINRNNILVGGKNHLFSIPLKDASSFKKIHEIEIDQNLFPKWKIKFFKTLELSYKKAPFYNTIAAMLEKLLDHPSKLTDTLYMSLKEVCSYLKMNTYIERSSVIYGNSELPKEERLIDICKKEKADTYINLSGGQSLYTKEYFNRYNINLLFLQSNKLIYKQFDEEFVPWLSIIDILMFNSPEEINNMLDQFELM